MYDVIDTTGTRWTSHVQYVTCMTLALFTLISSRPTWLWHSLTSASSEISAAARYLTSVFYLRLF